MPYRRAPPYHSLRPMRLQALQEFFMLIPRIPPVSVQQCRGVPSRSLFRRVRSRALGARSFRFATVTAKDFAPLTLLLLSL
ncbi:unnamed protein product [Litomosoides sigmodontis]|uniref:Uncharacterized protein n=1 Tax=Litomosoides sigmodontis TaxID=42156 RepID=A0A3P7M974_LITSI|nr:unnamed protein product [Litomosoides sigmodontis]